MRATTPRKAIRYAKLRFALKKKRYGQLHRRKPGKPVVKRPPSLGIPTSVRFPVEVEQELRKAALEEDRSISWIVQSILKQWLAFRTKVPPRQKAKPQPVADAPAGTSEPN